MRGELPGFLSQKLTFAICYNGKVVSDYCGSFAISLMLFAPIILSNSVFGTPPLELRRCEYFYRKFVGIQLRNIKENQEEWCHLV